MRDRRRWLWGDGYELIRMLERFTLEAPFLAEALGYSDASSLLQEGYGLDLVLDHQAERWLRFLQSSLPSNRQRPRDRLCPAIPCSTCACCGSEFSACRRDAR